LNARQALIAAAFVIAAALLALGVRANLTQSRIERVLTENTDATQSLTAIIEGELSGMYPDYSSTIDCGGVPLTINTFCGTGPGVDPNETREQCRRRHLEEVAAAQADCDERR